MSNLTAIPGSCAVAVLHGLNGLTNAQLTRQLTSARRNQYAMVVATTNQNQKTAAALLEKAGFVPAGIGGAASGNTITTWTMQLAAPRPRR